MGLLAYLASISKVSLFGGFGAGFLPFREGGAGKSSFVAGAGSSAAFFAPSLGTLSLGMDLVEAFELLIDYFVFGMATTKRAVSFSLFWEFHFDGFKFCWFMVKKGIDLKKFLQ